MLNVRTLEALLKARGWTQAELARRVGVSRQAVSLWFGGEEANLQGRHLIRLSQVLGVSVEELAEAAPVFRAGNPRSTSRHAAMGSSLSGSR